MLESIVEILQNVPWGWILIIGFAMTFLENVFPPAPCDSILVFTGTLVGIGTVGFIPLLLTATLGSSLGFIFMFWLGRKFGVSIVDSDKMRFINSKTLEKPEELFRKYGDIIIVANRFLSGSRAVISFFAGISKLPVNKTIVLSTVSALVWNVILIYLGKLLGGNWRVVQDYMDSYSKILIPLTILIIAGFVIRWLILRKRNSNRNVDSVGKVETKLSKRA